MDKAAIPEEYVKYLGRDDKEANSLYQCLKCATGSTKPLS